MNGNNTNNYAIDLSSVKVIFVERFFFSSLLVHLRTDYRYSFSVPHCKYKLINLRTRFLCIMATFARTLCLVPKEGRQADLHTVFPRVLFGRAPRRYPYMNIDTFLHTHRYVMRTYS